MTLTEIERAVVVARRAVFDNDEQVAERAQADLGRLLALLRQHPDERERADRLAAARDETLLFRWL